MITYIIAFIFYTLAMVGILFVGFIVYKKTFVLSKTENKGLIKIIDSYMIAPKKTLHIVRIRNEKFLIASDAATTTFLAKLDDTIQSNEQEKLKEETIKEDALKKIIKDMRIKQGVKSTLKNQIEDEKENLKNIQKQFMDLYKEENTENTADKNIVTKKEVIQKLLKELNNTKTSNIGSRY